MQAHESKFAISSSQCDNSRLAGSPWCAAGIEATVCTTNKLDFGGPKTGKEIKFKMKFSYLPSFFNKSPKMPTEKKIIGDRFEIITVLSNEGGFGKVYLCQDLSTTD